MLYDHSCDASGTDSTLAGSIGPFDGLDITQPAGSDASELPIDDPLTPSRGASELYPGNVKQLDLWLQDAIQLHNLRLAADFVKALRLLSDQWEEPPSPRFVRTINEQPHVFFSHTYLPFCLLPYCVPCIRLCSYL